MMELWGILDRNNPHVICCLLVKKASWFRNGEFTFFFCKFQLYLWII